MIHAYETGGRIEELVNMKLDDIIRNGQVYRFGFMGKETKPGIILFLQKSCRIWMLISMNFIQVEIIRIIFFIRSIMVNIRKWPPEQ